MPPTAFPKAGSGVRSGVESGLTVALLSGEEGFAWAGLGRADPNGFPGGKGGLHGCVQHRTCESLPGAWNCAGKCIVQGQGPQETSSRGYSCWHCPAFPSQAQRDVAPAPCRAEDTHQRVTTLGVIGFSGTP